MTAMTTTMTTTTNSTVSSLKQYSIAVLFEQCIYFNIKSTEDTDWLQFSSKFTNTQIGLKLSSKFTNLFVSQQYSDTVILDAIFLCSRCCF